MNSVPRASVIAGQEDADGITVSEGLVAIHALARDGRLHFPGPAVGGEPIADGPVRFPA